ncbi:5-oxoprolinase subunit PxpB [Mitsuaria sp. WAJ17]|uniref:5-oxoprolinase subunit PxpB n=1 Tax=Mitsuaria sp. WAJ17 TaxID=2761452 RepID=UPI0015FFA400|nr:5-oxoprolinase subunit PxpB [Mitsuaria sp. WAJ17]MBB2488155.1 5-oxoprolinase subunit PxpB [Mitsuaria sp. WAJ17]
MTEALQARCQALGERAVLLDFPGASAGLELQQRLWRLRERLLAAGDVVIDCVPGMGNLSWVFDPDRLNGDKACARLMQLWQAELERPAPALQSGRLVEIPVHYGGEAGPDLAGVARHHGLPPREVVRLHSQAEYRVFFLGFLPGFAYLDGLPAALHTPRLATPRTAVPAGSVGIGGAQTGVYPCASPGGWQLIGRTALCLFNAEARPPTLLQPGDRLRFVVERCDD